MRNMKKAVALVLCVILTVSVLSISALAADANVTYDGSAGKFIFAPGSDYSLTDLFPNFKDVMPGDTLTQKLTLKNNAGEDVKVKIYLRSFGAGDENTAEFLKKLKLTVQKAEDTPMFDAAADKTDGLTEWTYLGTLYSGGTVDINITLEVPTDLDNSFQSCVGKIKWQFTAEEFPIEDEYAWNCPNGADHSYHIEVINGVPTYVCDACAKNEVMRCNVCGRPMRVVAMITVNDETYTTYPVDDICYATEDGKASFYMEDNDDKYVIDYYVIDGVKTDVESADDYSLYVYYECVDQEHHTDPHRPHPHHDDERDSGEEWFAPLTGGEPAVKIWAALLGISAVGMIVFSRGKRQKDKERVER